MALIQKLFLCGALALGGCASLDAVIHTREASQRAPWEIDVKDSENNTSISSRSENEGSSPTEEDLNEVTGINIEFDSGEEGKYPIFHRSGAKRILKCGWTPEQIKRLLAIKDISGDSSLFFAEFEAVDFAETGVGVEYAETLGGIFYASKGAIKPNDYSHNIFGSKDIITLAGMKASLEEILGWADVRDRHGFQVFNGRGIIPPLEL